MADYTSSSIFSVAGSAASIANSYYGAQTQSSLLKTQAMQETMAATQRMSQRVDAVNQAVGQQRASAAARGIDLASTSVQAMSKQSYDAFNSDQAAEDLNQRIRDSQLRANLASVRNKEYASIFSTVAGQQDRFTPNNFNKKNFFGA